VSQPISESDMLVRNDIHLLVVDDDDRIRKLLASYLGKCGFRVSTVADSAAARQLMQTLEFDLLIIDVMMPGETGFEFTRSLREENDIPVILLTALAESENRIEGLKTGGSNDPPAAQD